MAVFLALFADLATIAIAYDNAPYAKMPVEWQLPKIWLARRVARDYDRPRRSRSSSA